MQKIKGYIYRYVDVIEDMVAYVGIVYPGHSLRTRINKELRDFEWIDDGVFKIEYQALDISQTDLQALEAHLISKYGAFYNIQKTNWGMSSFLDVDESKWQDFDYRSVKEVERLRDEITRLKKINNQLTVG